MSTAPAEADPIRCLEDGDWRTGLALLLAPPPAGLALDAMLAVELRTIARSLADRAGGHHVAAWTGLGVAAANLHRQRPAFPVLPDSAGDAVRLALPAEPTADGPARQAWRIVRLIWREQGELARLRRYASATPPEGLTRDRYILVLAVVEYLCWVQFDPATWLRDPPDDRAAIAAAESVDELWGTPRSGLLRSATDLRRLLGQESGDMTRPVWDSIGKYCGLRRLALRELARRSPPPWTDLAAGSTTTPARVGAWLAWTAANAA
jgi:hypothetical protein